MRQKNIPRETPQERMERRYRGGLDYLEKIRLPEAEKYADDNPTVKEWIQKQWDRMDSGYQEAHEPAFESGLSSWIEGWERVNELIARDYSVPLDDPECDWRYWRWKRSFHWVVLDCNGTELMIFRLPPAKQPKGSWLTIDAAMDVAHPLVKLLWETFGTLPVMKGTLRGPARGENHLHVYASVAGVKMETVFG